MTGRALARVAFLPALFALTVVYAHMFEDLGMASRELAASWGRSHAPTPTHPARRGDVALRGLAPTKQPSSALALARTDEETLAIVADEDRSALLVFDLPRERAASPHLRELRAMPAPRFRARFAVAGRPTSVLVTPDGTIVIALRERGALALAHMNERGAIAVDASVPACTEPVGLALSADAARVAVACAWGGQVAEVSLAQRKRVAQIAVAREPRAVAYGDDGTVYVTHAVGGVVSTIDFATHYVTDATIAPDDNPDEPPSRTTGVEAAVFGWGFFDWSGAGPLEAQSPSPPRQPPPTISLGQGFTFAALRGRTLVIPELAAVTSGELARTVRSTGYGGATLTVPAPSTESEVAFVRPDAAGAPGALRATATRLGGEPSSCRLPRASVLGAHDTAYFVGCFDRAHVAMFDVTGERPRAMQTWFVPDGPTGLSWWSERETLVVWSQFDRLLSLLQPFEAESETAFASDVEARAPTPYEVGRKLFHATDHPGISNDGRACATCHPDGRDDGLVWSSPAGPRQTPALAGRLATSAPYGWNGESKTVREHLEKTLQRLGGTGLKDAELYALLTYLAKMPAPPSAAIAPAHDSATLADRGAAIFRSPEAGCASCHDPTGAFTDGETHDVKSSTPADGALALDTPSLRFIGRTAPYFHDGRYASLRELLVGVDGTMGRTKHLSHGDLDALAAYLETL